MHIPKVFSYLSILSLSFCLQSCALIGSFQDQRLSDTISQDQGIENSIKKNLMSQQFREGWNISVYSFYGNVFLIGETPEVLLNKALDIAKKNRKVCSITAHWFTHREGKESDQRLASRLRNKLIQTKSLSSTRIKTEVNAGRVVLLGVVENLTEKEIAINATRETPGVLSVTSYLLFPPIPGMSDIRPSPEKFSGLHPEPPVSADQAAHAEEPVDSQDTMNPHTAPQDGPIY